jgi:ABC-type enterochelin transport system ATPase subunit
MKDGKVRFSGGKDSFTEAVIDEIYDAKVSILDIKDRKIIVNGGIL